METNFGMSERKIDTQALTVPSTNSPVSDYAELLFRKAFGWKRAEDAASRYDAIDQQGTRYLIKARRITPIDPKRQSRQLSAIRNLDNLPFDFLASLLVDENFQVIRAALVPVGVVWQLARYVAYTNSWRLLLRDSVWTLPDVRDVTSEVRSAGRAFESALGGQRIGVISGR